MSGVPMNIVEPFDDCNDLLQNRDQLRLRAAEIGYLYFPRLLPADGVLQLRHEVLQVHQQHGLLREGSDPDKAIRGQGVYVDVEYTKPSRQDFL